MVRETADRSTGRCVLTVALFDDGWSSTWSVLDDLHSGWAWDLVVGLEVAISDSLNSLYERGCSILTRQMGAECEWCVC